MNTLPTRILIVEDNSDDEVLLLHQLKQSQLHRQVRVIGDGRLALDYLVGAQSEAQNLVAVFLDLQLPTLSGLELLRGIRSLERIRHLPVILMTTDISPADMKSCRALGVSSYVNKPISFSAFTKAVADTFHARPGAPPTPNLMRDSQNLLLRSNALTHPAREGGIP